jgi:hypothetical protein
VLFALQLLLSLQSCCVCQGKWLELTEHFFWIGFCNCIGIYVVSFSFNYTTDGWTRAVDPVTILGSTAVTARGNAFFWLNDIWGLQIRKTSYPINLSLKASPSV